MLEFTYSRISALLKALLFNEEPLSAGELADLFRVSERTIRQDIKNLNEELNSCELKIQQKRNCGYYLMTSNAAALEQVKQAFNNEDHCYLESSADRTAYLLKLLLTADGYLTLDELIERLFISRNTLYNYLKHIKGTLEKFDLVLLNKTNFGFKIIGSEIDKRECLIANFINKEDPRYLMCFTASEKLLFPEINLDVLYQKGGNFFVQNFKELSDFSIKNILLHIAVSLSRIKQNLLIDDFTYTLNLPAARVSQYQQFLEEIFLDHQVPLLEAEKSYLFYHLVANIPQLLIDSQDPAEIEIMIADFLDRIDHLYGIDLTTDEKLKENLLKHLRSLFQLLQLKACRKNPLVEMIQHTFPLAYEIAFMAADQLPALKEKLSTDEIAYLALHIGAALERKKSHKALLKAALVCGSGNATIQLLENKLLSLFKDSLIITGRYSFLAYQKIDPENFDIIISTLPLEKAAVPIVQIDLQHFHHGISNLVKNIEKLQMNNLNFKKYFRPDLIFVKSRWRTKKQILKEMSRALFDRELVNSSFYEAVLKREALYPSTLGNGLAIPHPMTLSSVSTSCIAITMLEKPIPWGNQQQIDFIWLLAITPEDYAESSELFDFLNLLQENTEYKKMLLESKSSHDFLERLDNLI